jgi:tetratricopeptide (TPR) repeat protein
MMPEPPIGEVAAIESVAETIATVEMGQPTAPGTTGGSGTLSMPYLEPSEVSEEPGGEGTGGDQEGKEKDDKPPAKPGARFLTIVIVLATLVAALGGFLLNRASAAASNSADYAQELSLEGSAAETSAYEQAESDYSQYLSLQSLQAQAAQEMLESTYDQAGTTTWADLYASTSAQAKQTAALLPSDLQPDLPDGDLDPGFPADFFAQRALHGTDLEAESNAYNDISTKWSRLVDSYTAILTMVAVSLFLFGSAYVLYGRNRILFTILGGLLVLTGVVWGGGLTAARAPGAPSSAAAMDYAEGLTALEKAGGVGGFQTSINDFTKAIKLRPDFALAYAQRATAEAYRGSESIGVGYLSVVAPYWEKLASADELEAYDLGDHDPAQILNVGWSYYTLWLSRGGVGPAPSLAVTFFAKAAHLDPTYPIDWLDLGLAQLATHNYDAASTSFTTAVTNMLFTCSTPGKLSTCTGKQPIDSSGLQAAWLGGGMQGLEDLAQSADGQHSPQLRAKAQQLESMLSDSMATGRVQQGPYPGGPKVSISSAYLSPASSQLWVEIPASVSPSTFRDEPVTELWFERPAGTQSWVSITDNVCWGQGSEGCEVYQKEKSNNYFVFNTFFLGDDLTCYKNLQYRAEVWVGGKLAGSVTLGPDDDFVHSDLSPALGRGMDMAICVPSTWHQQTLPRLILHVYGTKQTVTGPLSSSELFYASPDHSEGAYLFRLYPPRTTPSGAQISLPDVEAAAVDQAFSVLKGNGLPSDLAQSGSTSTSGLWGDLVSDMRYAFFESPSTHMEAMVGVAVLGPSLVPPYTPSQQDNYISGEVPSDYAIAVTIVYGPHGSAFWDGPLGLQVFTSWSLLADG